MTRLALKAATFVFAFGLPMGLMAAPAAKQDKAAATMHASAKIYHVTIHPGSLQATMQRLAKKFHWRLVWKVPNDYSWTGEVTLSGPDLPTILDQLLKDFPVQARFYQGNHVLLITPRSL